MKEYYEILARSLAEELLNTTLPSLLEGHDLRVEGICYQALKEIKACLEDCKLDDKSCFCKIEEVISSLERIGVLVSDRHDYG